MWKEEAPGDRGHTNCGKGVGDREKKKGRDLSSPGLGMRGSGGIALQEELQKVSGVRVGQEASPGISWSRRRHHLELSSLRADWIKVLPFKYLIWAQVNGGDSDNNVHRS